MTAPAAVPAGTAIHGSGGNAALPSGAIAVRLLDLDDGLRPVTGCGGYAALRLLVRRGGRPLGWLHIADPGDVVAPARLRAAMYEQRSGVWSDILEGALVAPFASAPLPPVSVVVCTRDRAEDLDGCLRSLVALDYPVVERIVVDNASRTGAARETAERWGVRYVREDRPGLDNARNTGLLAASHELVAFTDDDARPDPRWLRLAAPVFVDPAVGAVTGLVAPLLLDTEARRLFELVYGGMGKGTEPFAWYRGRLDDAHLVRSHNVGVGANMIIRRRALLELGGFDPALDVGTPSHGAGDLDILHRLLVHRWVVRYEPAALVWHRHRATIEELRRQLYDNGRAYGIHLLCRLRDGDVPRLTTLRVALEWLSWLGGRVFRRLRDREAMPMPLILAEIAGALSASRAYRATYRAAAGTPRPALGAPPR